MGDREQRLEEILAEWDLDKAHNDLETYSIDLSSVYSNVSLTSPYTISSGINLPNGVYTTTGTTASPWTYSPNTVSSKISLDGKDADIEINGVSMWKTMQEISNRLNIMHTNPKLETEWAELRELGERYRKLEQHILDKQATFDRIKAMPAPEVD
jgi:hypothetical protein